MPGLQQPALTLAQPVLTGTWHTATTATGEESLSTMELISWAQCRAVGTVGTCLWVSFSAKGGRELHIPPLDFADVVCGGIDLGSQVQDVDPSSSYHCVKAE